MNYSWAYQRYGEYKLQYADYNGNADTAAQDNGIAGDEDGNGNIIWDEDDKDIGDGPIVFSWATPELYTYEWMLEEAVSEILKSSSFKEKILV